MISKTSSNMSLHEFSGKLYIDNDVFYFYFFLSKLYFSIPIIIMGNQFEEMRSLKELIRQIGKKKLIIWGVLLHEYNFY